MCHTCINIQKKFYYWIYSVIMSCRNYILWSSEMLLPAALLSIYWQEGRSRENDRKREREREKCSNCHCWKDKETINLLALTSESLSRFQITLRVLELLFLSYYTDCFHHIFGYLTTKVHFTKGVLLKKSQSTIQIKSVSFSMWC